MTLSWYQDPDEQDDARFDITLYSPPRTVTLPPHLEAAMAEATARAQQG